MKKLFKTTEKKIIPVGLAMGVLFSGIPLSGSLTEHKVHADVGTTGAVLQQVGNVYKLFIERPLAEFLELESVRYNNANRMHENIAYLAPTFRRGEFSITVFDYYKNQNFSKNVKLLYPSGQIEYKTIKFGEQLTIKQAGTIVDLNPDTFEPSKHDLLYITQQQLDDGNTGISLTNFGTYYQQKRGSGYNINTLGEKYLKQEFRYAFNAQTGFILPGYNEEELFNQLPEDKRIIGTVTAQPVGREILSNYVMNNSTARADFNNRAFQIVTTNPQHVMDVNIKMGGANTEENWKIIPIQAGTNKVVVKTSNGYFTGERDSYRNTQYTESINNARVFKVVAYRPHGSRINDSATVYFKLMDESGNHPFVRNNENNKFIDGPYNQLTQIGMRLQPESHSNINFMNKTNSEILYLLVNLFDQTRVTNWWSNESGGTNVLG
ncbi:hypothetical protein [Bacillus mycoides]|uniref:hypothetical protein n=1 Tax=Bacillus mycoides TaxID=1405 RepID=UPI0025A1DA53|nr:hypothetical protein [Bacillus mycoides]MDM5430999.1 hypothetical protein [Bacillus mycoides]